jgi:2-methylcitrate dehydratase PrpD
MNDRELMDLARRKAGGPKADFQNVQRIYRNLVKQRDEMKKSRSLWGYHERKENSK